MKIFLWITSGLLALMVAGLAFVYFSPGYDIYVVRSESMKPTINIGDMVIIGPVGSTFNHEIRPGVIVTYQTGKSLITHRVMSFNNGTLVTKGDAVEEPDPQPVLMSQVIGVYLFGIPKIGYLASFLHTKPGWFLLVILPGAIMVAFIVKEIIKESAVLAVGR
jgi:signal peptidase